MTMPELTLESVKKTAKVKTFRASDFLTDQEIEEVRKSNRKGKKSPKFDKVDAYIAEIIARFGFDSYMAWKRGDITEKDMAHYLMAERAREARLRYKLTSILVHAVAGANHRNKNGQPPKTLKIADELLKADKNTAEGIE